jgi:hypothetical protein
LRSERVVLWVEERLEELRARAEARARREITGARVRPEARRGAAGEREVRREPEAAHAVHVLVREEHRRAETLRRAGAIERDGQLRHSIR